MQRLELVQQWMQTRVMAPASAADAGAVIRPSKTLTASERLDIYRGMYELRLIDALQVDYPGLHQFLGDETFREVAQLYVRQHPSRSYTLNRLGDHLPEFLLQIEGLSDTMFLRDLARFELAETVVFDEEPCAPVAFQKVTETLRLKPIPAMRMLALDYPVQKYLKESVALPKRRKTYLVVYRKGYAVTHLVLSRLGFALLQELCSGSSIGEALAVIDVPPKTVFESFQSWFSEGLFRAV